MSGMGNTHAARRSPHCTGAPVPRPTWSAKVRRPRPPLQEW